MKFEIIKGSSWEIKEVPGNDSMLLAGDKRCRGTTHYFHHEIYLDKDLPADEKRKTLIHELSHAMLYCTQIDCKDEFTEENLCEFMGIYADKICGIADAYFKDGDE